MLNDEIDNDRLNRRKTVWFTAWKSGRQEALWRAFILQVIGGLYPSDDNGNRLPVEKLDAQQKVGSGILERLERALYETVSWQEKGAWVLDKDALKQELIHLPLWLIFQLTGQFEAARDLGITPDLASTLERQIREHHLAQLQSMEQFAKSFEKAIRFNSRRRRTPGHFCGRPGPLPAGEGWKFLRRSSSFWTCRAPSSCWAWTGRLCAVGFKCITVRS